ncbi:MAG: DUF362 domain-containing protein [Desulfobacteraceae bacterium]|jgi:uncharacterized protein (DUF362 family)|nr:MAG: DUF362 domain-containing protein [Desulfobacteraceae bacterium]
MFDVALVKYESPIQSLRHAIELCGGFTGLSSMHRVLIKPNLVIWLKEVNFPKFGVITTARIIEDMVILLCEQGVTDIVLLEGAVEYEKGSGSMVDEAARGMNLSKLCRKYGMKVVDIHKGSFLKKEVDGLKFSMSEYILSADFIIDMPVLKTHSQARISLGIKNLKGLLNIESRKRCHNASDDQGLDHYLARLPDLVWPSLTIIDGIFSLERGPFYTGLAHRSDMIVASRDLIAADKVGSILMGFHPGEVPYLKMALDKRRRPCDLSDIRVRGNIDLKSSIRPHGWKFEQDKMAEMPEFMAKAGIQGIRYPEPDDSLCTYCSHFINYIVMGILSAKNKKEPFDQIEMLYGKKQNPSGKAKYTLLAGQCQVRANSKNPLIKHCVKIKGCPPSLSDFNVAFKELGIELPEGFSQWMEKSPETIHMRKYLNNSEFDQDLFHLKD